METTVTIILFGACALIALSPILMAISLNSISKTLKEISEKLNKKD